MKITIKKSKDGGVDIKESKNCKEHDVINAYAVALGVRCATMFKHKKYALQLLDKAYLHSREIINDMYEG